MRLDLLGLEAFLAVADRGSFSRAAVHVGITQTALSHRLKKFEEQLGTQLFMRTTRSVSLTPTGLALLPKARQLIDSADSVMRELEADVAQRRERLAIGCLPTLAMQFLPGVLKEFRSAHPTMGIRVFDNSASEIADLVQRGEAEFGITILATNRWDLETKVLAKEPYVLLCPRSSGFAKRRSATWRELAGEPLIRISSQTGNRILIDDALGHRREHMTWNYEVQHVASAVALVAAGIGLTVVPRIAVLLPQAGEVAAVPIRAPSVSRTLVAVHRRGIPLSSAAQMLLALIARRLKSSAPRA